jgi:hypothetical protein
MSAKKARKAKTPTASKKRARFPAIEAALAGRPLTEAAAEPTADAAPVQGAAETTTLEPGPAEPAPDAPGLGAPTEDATTTGPAAEGDATLTEATLPEPVTADGAAPAVAAPASEALAELVADAPAPPVTTEPPTVEGVGTTAKGTTPGAPLPGTAGAPPVSPGTGKEGRKPRAAKVKAKGGDGTAQRLSALDAAARVLAEAGRAMTCPEMIAAMAEKGYWASPAGRTPSATLYSALLREVTTRGARARFRKAGRGLFALAAVS